jgi:cytochrome c oxidase cbb3-type subunit III
MADQSHHTEIDKVTGTSTTGHEWDGIKELNTPLPRWWIWTFYACIIWSIGYFAVYPAWPLVDSYTKGLFGYSSRAEVAVDLAKLDAVRGEKMVALAKASLADIEKDPGMLALARAKGKVVFGDNCAACHGSGGAGGKGFPNLNDDDWLWGGTLEQIEQTIKFGARSDNSDGHQGAMPSFGKDGTLTKDQIVAVANYVRSLSGLSTRSGVDLAAGKAVFTEQCTVCHGDDAKGNQELGSPNLTDKIWLYGSDEAALIETLTNGRGGVMPAWAGRLDPATIKVMAVYVHSLGGGK